MSEKECRNAPRRYLGRESVRDIVSEIVAGCEDATGSKYGVEHIHVERFERIGDPSLKIVMDLFVKKSES